MNIYSNEQRLFELSYPTGCEWKLLFREMAKGIQSARAWWSVPLRSHGGLYLITRLSDTGQLASALKTEEIPVEENDHSFLHYSKYPKNLHQVVIALWGRSWSSTVEAMRIRPSSIILQEWLSILDTFEGSSYFQAQHVQYLQTKEREATMKEMGVVFDNAPRTTRTPTTPKRKPPKRKPKTSKYKQLDWSHRWDQK